MTPFKGQTENAGHFLQPTTNAIGHKVIALLLRSLRVHQAEREDAYGRYCGRVGVGMQTKYERNSGSDTVWNSWP